MAAVLTLIGVVVGAALAYLGQRALDKSSRLARWAERSADTVADVQMFLTDCSDKKVWFFNPRLTPTMLADLDAQARVVRREVSVLAAGHPDGRIRETMRDLEPAIVATYNAFYECAWAKADQDEEDAAPSLQEDFVRKQTALQEAWGRSDTLVKTVTEQLHS
jgi:hypothetical protein